MIEWLIAWFALHFVHDGTLSLTTLVTRMVCALVLGLVVAGIYKTTRRARRDNTSLAATLVLLTVLIELITVVIGDNTARAFSLVGALAIVRFRTVVDDTRDTAYVIFAVTIGMTVGSGFIMAALVGVPVVGLTAWLLTKLDITSGPVRDGVLQMKLGIGFSPEPIMQGPVAAFIGQSQLMQASTTKQGSAVEYTYHIRWRDEPATVALLTALNQHEGVQSVEIKTIGG